MLERMEAKSTFYNNIKSIWFEDKKTNNLREKVLQGKARKTILNDEGALRIQGQLCVPQIDNLILTILVKAHKSR